MKKRYLRKEIEYALIAVTVVLFISLMSTSDFEVSLRGFGLIFGQLFVILVNVLILKKYGKGRCFEE